MGNINYKKVIKERHESRKIFKLEFKRLLIWIFYLIFSNLIIYFILFWDYEINYKIVSIIKEYVYWLLFFNNILLVVTIINFLFLLKETFIINSYDWERKQIFDANWNFTK